LVGPFISALANAVPATDAAIGAAAAAAIALRRVILGAFFMAIFPDWMRSKT